MTTESPELDKDGYKLVPKHYTSRGYKYDFVEDLGDNWVIYSVIGAAGHIIDYELVLLYKSEEYTLHGTTIPKKWNYPGASAFGTRGFSLPSVAACKWKLDQLKKYKVDKKERVDRHVDIPKNTQFTVPQMAKQLNIDPLVVYIEVMKLVKGGKCAVVGSQENPRGRASKVYMVTD